MHQNLKSCRLGWRFNVTLVAFLLPLILSTRAWASLIRSVMLLSWWRFFSTLSDTLQATTTEYGHMHIYTQRITVCQGYCTIQYYISCRVPKPPKRNWRLLQFIEIMYQMPLSCFISDLLIKSSCFKSLHGQNCSVHKCYCFHAVTGNTSSIFRVPDRTICPQAAAVC